VRFLVWVRVFFYFPFSFFSFGNFSLSLFLRKNSKKCKDTWALTYIWIYN
jgi:hypothetical protein